MFLTAAAVLSTLPARTIELAALNLNIVAVRPIEVDGDPATQEWLLRSWNGLYRIGVDDPTHPCISEPFHPDGPQPGFIPLREVPVARVGTRDKFVEFNAVTQTITIYDLPSGCQP